MIGAWFDGVIPLPMEVIAVNRHFSQLLIGDLDASRIGLFVQFRVDLESRSRGRISDEVDDRLTAEQRAASPILGGVPHFP